MDHEHSQMAMSSISQAAQHIQASWQMAASAHEEVAIEQARPFMLLKPKMYPDGNQWCALYGENLQEGVSGFGDTPHKASIQFDVEWLNSQQG